MAVELMSYTDAANAGIQSIEILLKMLSHQSSVSDKDIDYSAVADVTINNFKKFISVLDQNRTGHARFRRGPVTPIHQSLEAEPVVQTTGSGSDSLVIIPVPNGLVDKKEEAMRFGAVSEGTNSSISSLIGDSESVQPSGFQITNKSQVSWSMGRPPLPAAMKRKSMSVDDVAVAKCGSSSEKCHCLKKRKSTVNRVVRVPAISSKVADIPSDDFSWRKYGQKPIKGSPHPRGYYRCSSVKGCPALKHVERTLDDQNMLIVTYKGEHTHS